MGQSHKLRNFEIACHTGAAIGSFATDPVHALLNAVQVARLAFHQKIVTIIACALSVVVLGLEGRFLGSLGYAAIVAGWKPLASSLLAFHYGLMSFDAKDEHVISSASYAGLTMAYSIENFPE